MPTFIEGTWKPRRSQELDRPPLVLSDGPAFEVGDVVTWPDTAPYYFTGKVCEVAWSDLCNEWSYDVERGTGKQRSRCWYRQQLLKKV